MGNANTTIRKEAQEAFVAMMNPFGDTIPVTRQHAQDGIVYEISTLRNEGQFSVYTRVLSVDGKKLDDNTATSNIFGER